MTDEERIARHMFPKYDDIHTFTVRVGNQIRQVRRVGNYGRTSVSPGILIFTDCTRPMQNIICDESKIIAWRMNEEIK
jgi:hypothetical protein